MHTGLGATMGWEVTGVKEGGVAPADAPLALRLRARGFSAKEFSMQGGRRMLVCTWCMSSNCACRAMELCGKIEGVMSSIC